MTPTHEVSETLQRIIEDAVVETARRPAGLRGPWVFDEADLQCRAAAIRASRAPPSIQTPGTRVMGETVEWQDASTAPKDGTAFIGQCADETTGSGKPIPAVYVFWWSAGSFIGGRYGNSVHRLAGWMPLPNRARGVR